VSGIVRAALSGALMLSAATLELASMNAPVVAQTNALKCTGNPDIPWNEQIVGCTNAIKSGRYTGKDLAAIFNGRGTAYRAMGDFDRAIQDYDQAIKLNPNDTNAFYYRGIANGMRGEAERAIQDFDQAAWYSRGLTYSNKGLWDRAIQDYDEAIKLDPNYVRAISNRGNAYLAKREYDRAIQDYDQAIKLDPNEAIPVNNRGSAYYQIGQVDRAIQDFDLAITLNPNYSDALNNRGLAYIGKGQYEKTTDSRCQIAQGRKGASFEAFLKRHPIASAAGNRVKNARTWSAGPGPPIELRRPAAAYTNALRKCLMRSLPAPSAGSILV
jgi:tetratricopeptide (TPR) repeat protein